MLFVHHPQPPRIPSSSGVSLVVVVQVPTDKESAFFSFLNPLGYDIWIFVGGAFFMSSFTLFTLARFTPYEWVYPQPWKRNNYLVNQLSMSNSFWFITGTLLRQTSGVNPQVAPRRPPPLSPSTAAPASVFVFIFPHLKVPTSQQTRLFSFMNPLAMDIWLYVLSAYVLVSITMFVVLALRVAQPPSLRHGERARREPVLAGQLVLVHDRDADAARLRPQPEGTMLISTRDCVHHKPHSLVPAC